MPPVYGIRGCNEYREAQGYGRPQRRSGDYALQYSEVYDSRNLRSPFISPLQTKRNESDGQSTEIKKGNYLYQTIETINAPNVQEVKRLLEGLYMFVQGHCMHLSNFRPIKPQGRTPTSCAKSSPL